MTDPVRAGSQPEADPVGPVVDRRGFLAGLGIGVGTGLVLALCPAAAHAGRRGPPSPFAHTIRIGESGTLTLYVDKSELGQGAHTGLLALVAEELEIPWARCRVETLTLDGLLGRELVTAGSGSIRTGYDGLRRLGATARTMLIEAGAARLGVDAATCQARAGRVHHGASGRSLGYAELASDAGARPVPEDVPLKPSADFRLIGKPLPRVDTDAKVSGEARFGIDVRRPGMLYASVMTSPVFGGDLRSMDEAAALAVPGVIRVVRVPGGVAVCAEQYWQAGQGLRALAPRFAGGDAGFDTRGYSEALQGALDGPGIVTHTLGDPLPPPPDVTGPPSDADADVLDARYEVPFLAHAALEPMNCTAHVEAGRAEIWASTQGQTRLQAEVAEALGIPPASVVVHTPYVGGGFGRRYVPDFAVQAALISKSVGRPVKLIWSREEDMRHGHYRPAYAARLRARIASDGLPGAIAFHVAGPWYKARETPGPIRRAVGGLALALGRGPVPDWLPERVQGYFPRWVRDGWDNLATAGLETPDYAFPDLSVAYSPVDTDVPIGWWRSIGASQNVFFLESFVDEIAHRTGRDPLALRLALLAHHARARRVVEALARKTGGRDDPRPGPRRGRGVAYAHLVESFIAMQVEVEVGEDDSLRVLRIDCVVDCGQVVNPSAAEAQIETGALFALSAALHERITLRGGAVEQGNFDTYPLLSAAETPVVDVAFIESDAYPGGVGELSTPPLAPALCNAIHAATGRRIRRLPVLAQGSRLAAGDPARG